MSNADTKLVLTFNNDDEMAHNVVISLPESAVEVGRTAMNLDLEADELEYLPRIDKVCITHQCLNPVKEKLFT